MTMSYGFVVLIRDFVLPIYPLLSYIIGLYLKISSETIDMLRGCSSKWGSEVVEWFTPLQLAILGLSYHISVHFFLIP